MSYTREVTLWCDDEDCAEWVQLNNHESKRGTIAAARIAARVNGWTFAGGRDHCRKHSTFVAKIIPDPVYDGPTITLAELRAQHA